MFERIIDLLDSNQENDNSRSSMYQQAVDALDSYLSTNNRDIQALKLKVQLLIRLHRYALAKNTAVLLATASNEDPKYVDLYGTCAYRAGDFETAEVVFMRGYKLDPDGPLNFGGKYKEAKEMNKIKKEGNDYVTNGEYEKAIDVYTKGIQHCDEKESPCAFIFYNNRSACYINSRRYKEALDDINKSIALYPYLYKPYLRRISVIQKLQLEEQYSQIAYDYVNALYSSRFAEKSIQKQYINFLKKNKAFHPSIPVLASSNELNRVLQEDSDSLIVLDIFASWCNPCKMLSSILEELSVSHPSVTFVKIDGDRVRDVSEKYRVEGFPTLVLLRSGKEITRIVGYDPDKASSAIESNMGLEIDYLYSINWIICYIVILL